MDCDGDRDGRTKKQLEGGKEKEALQSSPLGGLPVTSKLLLFYSKI